MEDTRVTKRGTGAKVWKPGARPTEGMVDSIKTGENIGKAIKRGFDNKKAKKAKTGSKVASKPAARKQAHTTKHLGKSPVIKDTSWNVRPKKIVRDDAP